jgi:hypothetical protein
MLQANFCCNVNPWVTKSSPFLQLTGVDYVWTDKDHSFGEQVTYFVNEELRDDTYRPSGERGI